MLLHEPFAKPSSTSPNRPHSAPPKLPKPPVRDFRHTKPRRVRKKKKNPTLRDELAVRLARLFRALRKPLQIGFRRVFVQQNFAQNFSLFGNRFRMVGEIVEKKEVRKANESVLAERQPRGSAEILLRFVHVPELGDGNRAARHNCLLDVVHGIKAFPPRRRAVSSRIL